MIQEKQEVLKNHKKSDAVKAREILWKSFGIKVSRQGYRKWIDGGGSDNEPQYISAMAMAVSMRLSAEKQAKQEVNKLRAIQES